MRATDAGQAQIDLQDAKAHQEIATHNSQAAVRTAEQTREDLTDRVAHLERTANVLTQRLDALDKKYNLLLSKRFNTGPTE